MNKDDAIPRLIQDFIYAQDHRLLEDDVGRAVTRLMRLGIVDDLVRGLIQEPVRKHKIAQAFFGPISLPRLKRGNLILGFDVRGNRVNFSNQHLNAHSLTVGGTGCGKTTKSRFLILQIAEGISGLWCFDFVKREFSVLNPYLNQMGIELLVVPARQLRLNPLQCPDHVAPTDWAPRIADVLVQTLQLPPRATKLLHATILEMYRQFGIFANSERYPTLFDLRERIADDADANPQARLAVVDSLDPVLMSIGATLRYRVGWKTRDLARRHIVFELGGTAEVDKNLILNSLLLAEFTSRVAQGISNPVMDLFICCDEAARLVSSTTPSGGIADLIGLVRGTGIGLDLSIQSADVANAVLSNTANKFIGRCGSATDYDVIGASMGLTREQRGWLNANLRPGLFVGQIGESEWRRPFVLEIPRMRFPPAPIDVAYDGADGLKELMALPTVIADEFADWPSTRSGARSSSSEPEKSQGTGLSEADIRYIRAVMNNPGVPSSELPKHARISPKKAQEIRRRLVRLGFFREHQISTGKRGRVAVVLEPLEPALQAAGNITVEAEA